MNTKICKGCEIKKDITDFSKNGKYRKHKCKGCHNLYKRKWNERNKEHISLQEKERYKKNRDKILKRQKERYHEKKDVILPKQKIYEKLNRDKMRAKCVRYRTKKAKASPIWRDDIKIIKFYTIAEELNKRTNIQHHVDHIFPLNSSWVCGLHCEQNLTVLTYSQNISKSNSKRLPEEYKHLLWSDKNE